MKFDKKIVIIVTILALISFVSLTLVFSYSYVLRSKSSANVYNITTGNLSATLTYNATTNLTLEVLNETAGLAQNNYGEISISKNDAYSIFYTINIGYVTDNLPEGKTVDNFLPLEYVKVALFTMNGNEVSETPLVGPVRVADLPLFSVDSQSPYTATYILGFGTFAEYSQSAKYALKARVDADIADFDNIIVHLGASVNLEPLLSKSRYNVSGIVIDNFNEPVAGAVVSLQNGMIKTTTNASGAYTLSNVPSGTWNLSVTDDVRTYETTIHVDYGSEVELIPIGPNNGSAGSYLQASAYTYYTTPYKILKNNDLGLTTNSKADARYTVPVAYKLIGEDSFNVLNISNLQLKLDSSKVLTLSMTS